MIVTAPEIKDLKGPVIFLAGPTQGVRSWHHKAIEILQDIDGDIHIASPKRPINVETLFTEEMYNEQVDWETRYLRIAARQGVILFWLARERQHRCDRAYAQTTRFEIGEWKEYARRGEARLVVGIENGFTGARYIRRRFSQDSPGIRVCDTLRETCEAAVEMYVR